MQNPIDFGLAARLKDGEGAYDVRLHEVPRLQNRPVHMGLRREMHDGIRLLHKSVDEAPVAHVPLHELNLLAVQEVPQVLLVPRIRELVEDDDVVPLPHRPPGEVRADESGSTGDEEARHRSDGRRPCLKTLRRRKDLSRPTHRAGRCRTSS